MNIENIKSYLDTLEKENQHLKSTLHRLGYTTPDMQNSGQISSIEVYIMIKSAMDELEVLQTKIQTIRDDIYQFLDSHYDFSDESFQKQILQSRLKRF